MRAAMQRGHAPAAAPSGEEQDDHSHRLAQLLEENSSLQEAMGVMSATHKELSRTIINLERERDALAARVTAAEEASELCAARARADSEAECEALRARVRAAESALEVALADKVQLLERAEEAQAELLAARQAPVSAPAEPAADDEAARSHAARLHVQPALAAAHAVVEDGERLVAPLAASLAEQASLTASLSAELHASRAECAAAREQAENLSQLAEARLGALHMLRGQLASAAG